MDFMEYFSRCKMRFNNWTPPRFQHGKLNEYNWLVQYPENFVLGYMTDIGAFSYINAKYGVIIEDFVQIGSHTSIYSHSTIDNKKGPVKLEKNCRIGSHSIIMPFVSIGKNSIIGAFSFVNKNIPENVLAYGIPVKIIRNLTLEELKQLEGDCE